MLDFLMISTKAVKKGMVDIYPKFLIKKSSDLMIRGGDFYAVWVEDKGIWSTDEQDALSLIDKELQYYTKAYRESHPEIETIRTLYLWDASSGMIDHWHKYCQKQMRDSFHMLDETLIFANSGVSKDQYASKRLNYPLEKGDISAYDKLISTLYSEEERRKIEWAIGAIVSGKSKEIQKFMVFYGAAGTGKSTIINIIQDLFEGYYTVFDAKALGSASSSFALESFRTNPLVAIQHDGDLSRIEDNTRLNSLVSHELMTVNEKFKTTYANRFKCFLILGTNRPVKITDAKSGLIRRLIDVTPTGRKIPSEEYKILMEQIKFELGAIAYHCEQVYLNYADYYDDYIPVTMLGASNDFYNFVMDSYYTFKKEDSTTLKIAWERYKTYCDSAKVSYPLAQRAFKEELKNYFRNYDENYRNEENSNVRCLYSGFRTDIFERPDPKVNKDINDKNKSLGWISFSKQSSYFDSLCSECSAQYANADEKPIKNWDKVKTILADLDTSKIHYVRPPQNYIIIDFDIPDENGNKCLDRNLDAANKFPPTYAEVSKSGKGIHLHYIYSGDVTKLSSVYSEHIEIKTFPNKSSLRRKLTVCNNLPVRTIASGLPMKEEKMINTEVITTEKGIRTTIKRNLLKEIHCSTKSSIDFIYKILEDAYTSGVHYDVSDMTTSILDFATKSTHQSKYCVDLVGKMHFKSDDVADPVNNDEKPLAFYDIEVFPNLFLVNWKIAGYGKPIIRMINPKPEDLEDMISYRLIGFNCRRYDNHLIYARLMGYTNEQLYNLSQQIITGNDRNAFFSEAYNLSYTDVYDFASAGNKKSLKKLEIEMGNLTDEDLVKQGFSEEKIKLIKAGTHHQELGLPWDEPVPKELWTKVAEYCDNDVIATEAGFTYLSADWTARQILADLAGLTVNDTTNTLTTRIIFGTNRHPQDRFCYRDLSKPVLELDRGIKDFLCEACPDMMREKHDGHGEGSEKSFLPYFPGYKYEHGISIYRDCEAGEGGYVDAEPGMHVNVALLDVGSMHPHSAIAECLFGIQYTKAYRDIVEGRVSIKHEAWDEVNNMLDGRLTPYIQRVINGEMTSKQLANALKTAINSVYGLTSASFDNPFRDPRNKDNIVAKRGALFMIDLKYEVQKRGFTVAHIKTDSIKIPNATPEIISFVMEFGKRYGYTFEHEATYDRMCLVNHSVYIAKYATAEKCSELYGYVPGDNKKHGGEWTATGTQFAVPYVFKTMFSKEPIKFNDMCETKSVTSALYLDMNERLPDVSKEESELVKLYQKYKKDFGITTNKELASVFWNSNDIPDEYRLKRDELNNEIAKGHQYKFVGKVGQFCPVIPGSGGGLLMRGKGDGKYYAVGGTTGFRWMESEMVKTLGKEGDIDRSYYAKFVDDAKEAIAKYGDYEWFVSDEPYIPKSENDFINIPTDEDVYDDEIPFY